MYALAESKTVAKSWSKVSRGLAQDYMSHRGLVLESVHYDDMCRTLGMTSDDKAVVLEVAKNRIAIAKEGGCLDGEGNFVWAEGKEESHENKSKYLTLFNFLFKGGDDRVSVRVPGGDVIKFEHDGQRYQLSGQADVEVHRMLDTGVLYTNNTPRMACELKKVTGAELPGQAVVEAVYYATRHRYPIPLLYTSLQANDQWSIVSVHKTSLYCCVTAMDKAVALLVWCVGREQARAVPPSTRLGGHDGDQLGGGGKKGSDDREGRRGKGGGRRSKESTRRKQTNVSGTGGKLSTKNSTGGHFYDKENMRAYVVNGVQSNLGEIWDCLDEEERTRSFMRELGLRGAFALQGDVNVNALLTSF